MSGKRIDDHSFWAGGPGKHSVMPDGPHKCKAEMTADGSGHIGMEYSDTTEMIRRDQMMGNGKIKSHKMKPGYRH